MKTVSAVADPRITWPTGNSPVSAIVFAHHKIEINASAERVWSLLIDCVAWPRWYKHCSDVSILKGGHVLGQTSQFRFKTLLMYFEPEVTIFDPNKQLVWLAKGPAGSSGAHAWYIEPTPHGCRVITEEAQKGFLLYLVRSRTMRLLSEAHEEWLRALKQLAEAK